MTSPRPAWWRRKIVAAVVTFLLVAAAAAVTLFGVRTAQQLMTARVLVNANVSAFGWTSATGCMAVFEYLDIDAQLQEVDLNLGPECPDFLLVRETPQIVLLVSRIGGEPWVVGHDPRERDALAAAYALLGSATLAAAAAGSRFWWRVVR